MFGYRREWLRRDLVAGVSVAAVALPIAIAYAQLAGFPPVVGIYSSILPLAAYALFGSSRQLIVSPDAAACALIASTLVPLAGGDAGRYLDLAIALTFLTGILCIAGGLARLGVVANFLSRPILTGYLNGIALSIIAGQLGPLLGFKVPAGGFFRTLYQAFARLGEAHLPTVALGLSLLGLLWLMRRVAPAVPGPLVAAVLGIVATVALGLDRHGVATVGPVPAGFPTPHLPDVRREEIWPLVLGASGLMLVSFCSMMTTARAFAARNGYSIDPNKDMIALGFSDLASAFSRGFAVSGADSRTAVADASGGKTKLTGIVAGVVMAMVLLFFTAPLAHLPTAALAAILISAAVGLFDIASLRYFLRVSPPEFRHSLVAMLGVMTVGVLPGVLVALALAMIKLLTDGTHPHDTVRHPVAGEGGQPAARQAGPGEPVPSVLVYGYEGSLLFFNADYFLRRVRALLADAGTRPTWFIFNAEAVPLLDVTGAEAIIALQDEMQRMGVVMAITRPKGTFSTVLERSGAATRIGRDRIFPDLHAALGAYLAGPTARPASGTPGAGTTHT